MKSKFKYYLIIWVLIIVAFNVVVFVLPREIAGTDRFTGAFWIGYVFIMVMLLAQLGIGWLVFREDNLTKLFYNISLMRISISSLIAMGIVGLICMAVPLIPVWLGVIVCLIALIFSAISLMRAQTAISTIEDIDKKIKVKTFFIKSLLVDIEVFIEKSSLLEIRNELKNLYDAVHYSDPMSEDALSGIETQITLKMSELLEGVEKSDVDIVKNRVKEINILLNERNKKCKLLK